MTSLPLPMRAGHGPARKRNNPASSPVQSVTRTLTRLNSERRERDHGRAIFLTGLLVSTRTTGRASLNSGMGSKPVVRSSAFLSHPRGPSRAVRARVLRGFLLPAFRLWRTQFVRAVKVARHLLSVRVHSASRVCQNPTPRTIEQLFHLLSFLPCYVSKHSQGANAACAKNLSRRCKQ
jgi:hypothetical protein